MRQAAIIVAILTSVVFSSMHASSKPSGIQISPPTETPHLIVLDRSGKTVNSVTEPGTYSQPVFSSDHKRLAVVKADVRTQNPDIWIIDLATGRSSQLTSGTPSATPVWSPDGSQIAYVSTREGVSNIY